MPFQRNVPLILLSLLSWLRYFPSYGWVTPNFPQPSKCMDTSLSSVGKGKGAQKRLNEIMDPGKDEFATFDGRLPVDQNDPAFHGPPNTDPLAPLVLTIVQAADTRKAEEIRAIRVSKLTATTSFIVMVSGNSRPQNQAISVAIQDSVEEFADGMRTKGNGVPEGDANSGWILLDYGNVIVHIMTPKSRLFYDIEGMWKKGEEMDLTEVLVPNTPIDMNTKLGGQMTDLEEEDDPFWS